PVDGGFVEIHEDLFRFEIFFEAPRAELAAETRLFVAAPRRFNVSRLHVIDPHDACAQRLHNAKRFIDVASPDGGGEPVRRVVGNSNGVSFTVERDHGSDRAENLFAGNASGIVHVIKNNRLDVIALSELFRAATADGDLCFFLAELEIGVHAVILFLADERTHLRFTLERRAELDTLGLLSHGLDEFRIDFLFDKDAATRGTDLALIDEHAEKRAIDGRFPVGVGKENVRRFTAELKRDSLERVCRAFDDDLADSGAAGKSNFVDARMRDEGGASRLAETVNNVHHAGRQTNFREPVCEFEGSQRRLLG